MALGTFFGCLFISFGPVAALFFLTVAKDAQDVIVLIASGFFWLLALLFSALWWLIVSPLKDELAFAVVFSVLFQEGFRYLYFRLLKKADAGLVQLSVSVDSPLRRHKLAYVSGMGFGIVQGIFAYTNVLKESAGAGTVGFIDGHPDQYFFFHSALMTCCFILLHTFWGVMFYDGFNRKKYIHAVAVVCMHWLTSLLTLLNQQRHSPAIALVINYLVLLVCVGWSYHITGLPLSNLSALFQIRAKRT
ncbi:gamma-secretase subunit Aph-1-like [Sycon ciliatum]|uniref:gamma-secretase subunit Aph-1-like n=1 Tax=Sycon ciliatum TaxID=27933 RepID=UPI0020AB216A|eukprot:scpid80369/ scgid34547/ Gamma-secretase subunit Aph-1b; Anterior-pharynx-defective protein 1b